MVTKKKREREREREREVCNVDGERVANRRDKLLDYFIHPSSVF